jgi:hypothetical protein
MGKPNPLNSSSGGFHRGRRKDTRKGLVSSTSSRRNTCKKRKTVRGCHRRRKHITRKITGGGNGFINVVVNYFNNNEKPDDFKFVINRVEYPGGSVHWRDNSVIVYEELIEKLKGVSGNMDTNIHAASYNPGGLSMGAQDNMQNNGYRSMSINSNSIKPLAGKTGKNNVDLDLLVDRIDEFAIDPNTKEAAKKLLANMDKVNIDPFVWSNFGQFLKKNGINISTEQEKNIKDSLYKVGDVIVSYKKPELLNYSSTKNVKEKTNVLNIGKILSKEFDVKFILHNSDGIEYEIAYTDVLEGSNVMKLFNVKLSDDEIKNIQAQFDRIDYQQMPELSGLKKSVLDIAVDIQNKKKANQLGTFNIEDFVDKQYLKDASTSTTGTNGTNHNNRKDVTKQNTPKQLNNSKILTMLMKDENKQYLDKFLKSAKGGNITYYNGGGRNDGFEIAMAMILLLDDDDDDDDYVIDNNNNNNNNNSSSKGNVSTINTTKEIDEKTNSNITLQDINKSIYKLIFNKNNCEITEEFDIKKVDINFNNDNDINNIIEIEHIKTDDPFEELKLLLLERLCLEIDSIIKVIETTIFIAQIERIKTFIDYINGYIDIYNTNSKKFNYLQKFWKNIKRHFNSKSNNYKDLAEFLSEDKINENLKVFENFDENINEITDYYIKNIRNKSLYTKNIPIEKRVENLTILINKFKYNISKNTKQRANTILPYTEILLEPLTKINDLSDVDTKAKRKYYNTYKKYFTNTSLTDKAKSIGKTVNITDNNENITKIIENINNEKKIISETINNYNNETLKDKNNILTYFNQKETRNSSIKRVLGNKIDKINKHLDDMNTYMKYLWTIIINENKIPSDINNYNYSQPFAINAFNTFNYFLNDLRTEINKLNDRDLIKKEYYNQFSAVYQKSYRK